MKVNINRHNCRFEKLAFGWVADDEPFLMESTQLIMGVRRIADLLVKLHANPNIKVVIFQIYN